MHAVSVAQSCLIFCDPLNCSSAGSSVSRILQARQLEQVTISFSWDLPGPGIKSESLAASALAGAFFTTVLPGKPWDPPVITDINRRERNESLITCIHERAWQPTPVFLPGKSRGQRSLVGYGPWHRKELDSTEATKHRRAYMRETQGNWVTPWNGPSHHLKYRLQLKTKEYVEGAGLGGDQEKHSKQRYRRNADLSQLVSPLIRFSGDLVMLAVVQSGRQPSQVEISLINVNLG